MDIKIDGIDDLMKQLNNLGKTEDIASAMKQGTTFVKDQAKNLCPVDSGDLRKSIDDEVKVSGDTIEGTVFTDDTVDYGIYVEFGTSKMAAQPFMYPALENNQDVVTDLITKALLKSLGGK